MATAKFSVIMVHAVLAETATWSLAKNTTLQCSLNGEWKNGRCVCRIPWTGSDCAVLSLLPVDRRAHPGAAAYGIEFLRIGCTS